MGLLWTLPTPQTILTIGSAQELFRLVTNCKSWRLSFQVSRLEYKLIITRLQSFDFSNDYISPLNCVHYLLNYNGVWILRTWSNLFGTHIIMACDLHYNSCQILVECRCSIYKRQHDARQHKMSVGMSTFLFSFWVLLVI